MLKLVKPSYKYRKNFLEALDESEEQELDGIFYGDLARTNFKKYLTLTRNNEKGIDLPRGFIPCSTFWLVNNDKFIGGVSFRHRLIPKLRQRGGHIGYSIRPSERKKGYGTKMLSLTLKRVKKFGLKKVLVTCDNDNIGSRKIIQANGGILEDIIKTKYNKKPTMRWWINLDDQ